MIKTEQLHPCINELTVSVIIPTYNYGRFISEAIDSVFAQTYQPREVIVVDDGSTDETMNVLAQYEDRVRIIRQDKSGPAMARNAGAQAASGELLAFLDADDVWMPRKLELQVERFRADPELGLIHCGVEETDEAGATLRRRRDGREGRMADELLPMERPVVVGSFSAAIIPASVFKSVAGFATELPAVEDWDLCYRIARQYRIGFVPEVLFKYRLHGMNSHLDLPRRERAVFRAYAKAFAEISPHGYRLRRRAYGNLHMALAARFYASRQPVGALLHAIKSLWFRPRAVSLPIRWWRQQRALRAAQGQSEEPRRELSGN